MKAKAGSGKTKYLINEAIKGGKQFLFLFSYVRDCEAFSDVYPDVEINRQFGASENRSYNVFTKITVSTFNSYGINAYGSGVEQEIRDIEKYGIIVVDEVDLLCESVRGTQEAFCRLFRGERKNIIGLTATPDKSYDSIIERDFSLKIVELEKKEEEYHCKIVKLVDKEGRNVSVLRNTRLKELIDYFRVLGDYDRAHILLFLNNGEFTKDDRIDNCIFSEGNEDISRKKLLKPKGIRIDIKSKGKKVEITQSSNIGSRLYSIELEDFKRHFNVYIGEFNPDVSEQHFRRVRSHKTTSNNPDYMFITMWITEKIIENHRRKVDYYNRVVKGLDKLVNLPENSREKIKEKLEIEILGNSLAVNRLKHTLREQNKIKVDEELVLQSRDEPMRPRYYEDVLENDKIIVKVGKCELEFKMYIRRFMLENKSVVKEEVYKRVGLDIKTSQKAINDLYKRCELEVSKEIEKKREEFDGDENMLRKYYNRIERVMKDDNYWVRKILKGEDKAVMKFRMKIELKPKFMRDSKTVFRILLLNMSMNSPCYDFKPYMAAILGHCLKNSRLLDLKEGEEISVYDMVKELEKVEFLPEILGYQGKKSGSQRAVSLFKLIDKMEEKGRVRIKGKDVKQTMTYKILFLINIMVLLNFIRYKEQRYRVSLGTCFPILSQSI